RRSGSVDRALPPEREREPPRRRDAPASFLDAADQKARDVGLLKRQEEEQNRHHGQDRSRHHQLRVLDVLADEDRERDRERVPGFTSQDDQRPDEVVPRREERHDRERRQGRLEKRQDDPAEDRELSGPLEARRIEEVVGNRERELAHQKDAED